ncbi:hypothetical protein HanRHA438_Chr12g0537061 [Helianthus annuus]|nr:hypothetical protein HanRHA438_Chr12g0537061 [Helianthus annuus]
MNVVLDIVRMKGVASMRDDWDDVALWCLAGTLPYPLTAYSVLTRPFVIHICRGVRRFVCYFSYL